MAARSASAAVVEAVTLRLVVELAPVAARIRMSLAVSLRMRPTLIASTPKASTIPAVAASLPNRLRDRWEVRLSTTSPPRAAAFWAASIWLELREFDECTSHAAGTARSPKRCMPAAVMRALGSDVPVGRATRWTVGWTVFL
jgi:hypothetical protein